MDAEQHLKNLIERVMSAHWDMAACQCWFCREARSLGCHPRGGYDRKKYPVAHDAFGPQIRSEDA